MAAALSGIGWTFNYRGEYAQALPYLKQSLEMYRDIQGEESPSVVLGLFRVGSVLVGLERYSEAEEMLLKARQIARTLSRSGDNQELVGILEMLAACLRARFDYDGAQAMLEEMWQIQRRRTPSDTDGYSWCFASEFQFERPDFAAGDRLSREGYQVLCAISAEENHYRVAGQAYRGWALGRLGRFDEAEPLLRRAVELTRQHTHDDHRCLARGLAILGWLLVERGKYDEAEGVLREALPKLAKRDDPHVSEGVYGLLGQALAGQGDFDAAQESLSQALEMCVAKYGKEHPSAAGVMLHLAELHHDQAALNSARLIYEESLSILRKFLKSSHPSILRARVGLAKLLMDQGELIEAEEELRDALTQQIKVMGENHPHVARTKCLLGACLAHRGFVDDARVLFGNGFDRLSEVYPPQHRFLREAAVRLEE